MLHLCYLLITMSVCHQSPVYTRPIIQTCQVTSQEKMDVTTIYLHDFRWRLWMSDLIGWSQYDTPTWKISAGPLTMGIYLRARNSKIKSEIVALLKALNMNDKYVGQVPNSQMPQTAQSGQTRFLKLLDQMEEDFVIWSSVYSEQTATTPICYDSKTEATLRKWIVDFETFPSEFPKERYLSGFARLYGLILRLQWDHDLKPLSTQFLKLKQDYTDSELICVMADWYNSLLLCYLEPSNQQALLKSFYTQHKDHKEWIVVQVAQENMERKSATSTFISNYFRSALRRGSVGTPPVAKKHPTNSSIVTSSVSIRF